MGCDGLWSYLTNFVVRLKLEREKPSSPMYLLLYIWGWRPLWQRPFPLINLPTFILASLS